MNQQERQDLTEVLHAQIMTITWPAKDLEKRIIRLVVDAAVNQMETKISQLEVKVEKLSQMLAERNEELTRALNELSS